MKIHSYFAVPFQEVVLKAVGNPKCKSIQSPKQQTWYPCIFEDPSNCYLRMQEDEDTKNLKKKIIITKAKPVLNKILIEGRDLLFQKMVSL